MPNNKKKAKSNTKAKKSKTPPDRPQNPMLAQVQEPKVPPPELFSVRLETETINVLRNSGFIFKEGNNFPLDCKNNFGQTALHILCQSDHFINCTLKLIAGKIALNHQDLAGHTALHRSCTSNSYQTFQILIQTKEILDIQDILGETALHITCQNLSHVKYAKELVLAGINVNIQNEAGNTALFHALAKGDSELIDQLIKAGADHNLLNNEGITAISFALDHMKYLSQNLQPTNDYKTQESLSDLEIMRENIETFFKGKYDESSFNNINKTYLLPIKASISEAVIQSRAAVSDIKKMESIIDKIKKQTNALKTATNTNYKDTVVVVESGNKVDSPSNKPLGPKAKKANQRAEEDYNTIFGREVFAV